MMTRQAFTPLTDRRAARDFIRQYNSVMTRFQRAMQRGDIRMADDALDELGRLEVRLIILPEGARA